MWLNLKLMLLVRKYMNTLRDEEVNYFFEMLENNGIINDIETFGHVDNQGKLVTRFMMAPKLYKFYMKTSGRLLKSLLTL